MPLASLLTHRAEQFSKYANVFFLFTACIQQIPGVSPTNRWTTIVPLGLVLLASAFKEIKAPKKSGEREENETEKGLRVQDKGFLNTAVIQSQITYIDGEAGSESTS